MLNVDVRARKAWADSGEASLEAARERLLRVREASGTEGDKGSGPKPGVFESMRPNYEEINRLKAQIARLQPDAKNPLIASAIKSLTARLNTLEA